MYSTFLTYHLWGQFWQEKLKDAYFIEAFSSDRDTLWMCFKLNTGQSYQLEVKFVGGEMMWLKYRDESLSFNKNKHLAQFKELTGAVVSEVKFTLFDRLVILHFSNKFTLVFKGFGRFGNVLLFEPESVHVPISIFRQNLKIDWEKSELLINGIQCNTSLISINTLRDKNIILQSFDRVKKLKNIPLEVSKTLLTLSDEKEFDGPAFVENLKRVTSNTQIQWNKASCEWEYNWNTPSELAPLVEHLESQIPNYIQWFYFQEYKSKFIEKALQKLKSWKSQINQHTSQSPTE